MSKTSQLSRRHFLGVSAGTAATFGLAGCTPAAKQESPLRAEAVLTGGNILTMDPDRPFATALAVRGDRLLAVGSDEEILALAYPKSRRFDARGLTVLPGFIDSHSHPLFVGDLFGVNVDLRRIQSVKDVLSQEARTKGPGEWVLGVMYDDTKFEDGRPLTRADLDEAVPEHPALVLHRGGHTGVVNSLAFAELGVDADTPDPVGGKFYRDNGQLTGKVASNALYYFYGAGAMPKIDRDLRRKAAALASSKMAAAGLTSTTDSEGGLDQFLAYQDARENEELHFRISFMPSGRSAVYESLKRAGVRSGFGDEMVRIGAVKFLADGSASERTMRMSTPYEGRPDDFGILTMSQEDIHAAVGDAVAHGFRVGIHANGDVAIDMVLKAYERVLENHTGPNPRHRIEHCSLINDSLLARIKATGAIPTPFYTYIYYHGNKWLDYGEERMRSMFAHRSFLDAGIPVAPASDYVPGPYEPLMAIQSMVTRTDSQGREWGPNQRISVDEALRICTVNGAYASFEESIKGSLTPGKLADFVVLDQDPRHVDPFSIVDIRPVRTVMGGRTTFEA